MIRRPYLAWLGIGLSVVIAFAAGICVGAIFGVDQFHKWESAAKASVLTTELRALRAGNADKIIQAKEVELDGNVVNAVAFQESPMRSLLSFFVYPYDQTQSLKRVAQYRKQYQPVAPTIAPASGADDPADLRGFARDVSRSTEVLLQRYGN
jgi:hypothetical protein